MDRRTLLKTAAGGLLMSRIGAAFAAPGAAPGVSTTRLTDRVSVVVGAGDNVIVLAGDDGFTLVDSGGLGQTPALLAQLKALGGGPVRTVFNTHWHPECTGGNEVVSQGGAHVIAHHNTLQWLSVDHWVPAQDRYERARPKAAWPTEFFFDKGTRKLGGETVDYGYLLEAHTNGDIYVHLRESNVIAVGGAAAPDSDPELDWFAGGWVGGRMDALDLLLKLGDEQTRYIPSTGGPATRAQLRAELDTLTTIYTRMDQMVRKGMNTQEMLSAGVMDNTGRDWHDPKGFMYAAQKGVWAHYNTLSAEIV